MNRCAGGVGASRRGTGAGGVVGEVGAAGLALLSDLAFALARGLEALAANEGAVGDGQVESARNRGAPKIRQRAASEVFNGAA